MLPSKTNPGIQAVQLLTTFEHLAQFVAQLSQAQVPLFVRDVVGHDVTHPPLDYQVVKVALFKQLLQLVSLVQDKQY